MGSTSGAGVVDGCSEGVVTASTVNDLDSVLHSFKVNSNIKFTPVEKRESDSYLENLTTIADLFGVKFK